MFDFASVPDSAIQRTAEFDRIDGLPRRRYSDDELDNLAARLTDILRTPDGQMSLRGVQAQALAEAGMTGGMIGTILVGGGKTLISLLAPVVLRAWRPLLLVPAKLVDKTRREMMQYRAHWRIPAFLRIVSYELLGTLSNKALLEIYKPDLIIADECHKLANKRCGRTRRVVRYMSENPGTHFIGMTGTLTKRSIRDYAHLVKWALRNGGFLPQHEGELEEWADALDQNVKRRPHPGILLTWCNDAERRLDPVEAARLGYQRRMLDTPGVVTTGGERCDQPLTIQRHTIPMSEDTRKAFAHLEANWETPDGWSCGDAFTRWRHARELAMGFYYRWDPRPPEEWIGARKAWHQFCRAVITGSRSVDTEGAVADLVRRSQITCPEYWEWKEIEPCFVPNTVPVWLDTAVLQGTASWMQTYTGIVWIEHIAFGEALMNATRAPFYARGGIEWRTKQVIESERCNRSIIASILSNNEGRNLQAWNRGLITSMPPNGRGWEQLLGRMHRSGQHSPVHFDVLFQCFQHEHDFARCYQDAIYTWQSTSQRQKLLEARYL